MCLNPIYIVNKGKASSSEIVFNMKNGRKTRYFTKSDLLKIKDRESLSYLQVGCGHCAECASLKQSYISQRVQLMSTDHYVFYQTLTLNNRNLGKVDINDYEHHYFPIKYFQDYIKMISKYNVLRSNFKYLAVTEYGGIKHRPHMHILYFVPKTFGYWSTFTKYRNVAFRNYLINKEATSLFWSMLHYWRINHGDNWNPDYDNLLDFAHKGRKRNYDFQYVEEKFGNDNTSNVTHYVTKYVLKFDDWIVKKQQALRLNLSVEEYNEKWSLLRPRVLMSKNFGNAESYRPLLKKSIDFSLNNIKDNQERWYFMDLYSNKIYPLAPYLRRKFIDSIDSLDMFYNTSVNYECKDIYRNEYLKRQQHFNKVFILCRSRNNEDFFDIV